MMQEKKSEAERLKQAVENLQAVRRWSDSARHACIWMPWAKVGSAALKMGCILDVVFSSMQQWTSTWLDWFANFKCTWMCEPRL